MKKTRKWELVSTTIFSHTFQIKEIVLGNQYIWLTSERGLIRFDGRATRVFDKRYGLSHAISCVVVDTASILWIGTTNEGIYKQGKKRQKEVIKQLSVQENGLKAGTKTLLKHAQFKQGTDSLLDERLMEELQLVADFLVEHPTALLEIHGHTDNTGSQLKNWELSKKRVQKITQLLVDKGIDEKRLIKFWHGENKPLFPNVSEANKAQNRRVEVQIVVK